MGALHYAYIDASLNYSVLRMTWDTHHSYMDVLQYVCVDVPSEHSILWKTYYTYHS